MDDLRGHCETPVDLFGAITRCLAGYAEVVGEKSPWHLLWWRPLSTALPLAKFIVVVRDARAVVASALQLPWAVKSHIVQAQSWASDQRQAVALLDTLGPDRSVAVGYGELVQDPESTRRRLAGFLGRPVDGSSSAPSRAVPASEIYLPHEWWKQRTTEPVTTERVDAWRGILTDRQARDITAICRSGMARFGYAPGGAIRSLGRQAAVPPREQLRRARWLALRTARRARIAAARIDCR